MKIAFFLFLIFTILFSVIGCSSSVGDMSPSDSPNIDWNNAASFYSSLDFVWNDDANGYYVYEKDSNPYTDIVIPATYNGEPVVGIGKHAFGAYSKVRTVIVPDTVFVIDTQAFNYCDYLESVIFSKSSGLVSIKDYAFYNCKSIEAISIPASVREIGYMAFSTCPSISEITVDEGNVNYCSIYGVIYSRDMKVLVAVPPALRMAEEELSHTIIPMGVEIIGAGAFANCKNLFDISIPDSVTTIEKAAFAYCNSLKQVSFGENSNLTKIGESSFRECASLEAISIPKNVSSIGRYALYCNNNLIKINYGGTTEAWERISKGEKWDVNTGNYVVDCINGSVSKNQ